MDAVEAELPARWRSLLDDPRVETVEILGHDRVHLLYDDGHVAPAGPVADSDAELAAQLRLLAYRAEPPQPFGPAQPTLTLSWPGGPYLHAVAADVTDRPSVVLRRHPAARQPDQVTPRAAGSLQHLAGWGMLPSAVVDLLSAAVRAGETIVVGGGRGTGKTTLLWAVALAGDPGRTAVLDDDTDLDLDRWHTATLTLRSRAVTISPSAVLDILLRQNVTRFTLGELTSARADLAAESLDHDLSLLTTVTADTWPVARDALWSLLGGTAAARRLGGPDRLNAGSPILLVQLEPTAADDLSGAVSHVVEVPTRLATAAGDPEPAVVVYDLDTGLQPAALSEQLRRRLVHRGGWRP